MTNQESVGKAMTQGCDCKSWVEGLPTPDKVIGFRCNRCLTVYTMFPSGEIAFEQNSGTEIGTGL